MEQALKKFLDSIGLDIDNFTDYQKSTLTDLIVECMLEGKRKRQIQGGIVGGIL